MLKPCGQATARLVDSEGKPSGGVEAWLHMVVTPAAWPVVNGQVSSAVDAVVRKSSNAPEAAMDAYAGRYGRLAADEDFVANVDRTNYSVQPKSDADGRVKFPALIPAPCTG